MQKFLAGVVVVLLLAVCATYVAFRLPFSGSLPEEAIAKAKELDSFSKNKTDLALNVYNFVNESYPSPIREYLRQPNTIYIKDVGRVWALRGSYVPSNAQNEIIKAMLISTGKFKTSDFVYHEVWCEITPHEWYELDIDGKKFALDVWSADHGGRFGCYAFKPCDEQHIRCLS